MRQAGRAQLLYRTEVSTSCRTNPTRGVCGAGVQGRPRCGAFPHRGDGWLVFPARCQTFNDDAQTAPPRRI